MLINHYTVVLKAKWVLKGCMVESEWERRWHVTDVMRRHVMTQQCSELKQQRGGSGQRDWDFPEEKQTTNTITQKQRNLHRAKCTHWFWAASVFSPRCGLCTEPGWCYSDPSAPQTPWTRRHAGETETLWSLYSSFIFW